VSENGILDNFKSTLTQNIGLLVFFVKNNSIPKEIHSEQGYFKIVNLNAFYSAPIYVLPMALMVSRRLWLIVNSAKNYENYFKQN